jgi:hypothetical protein
LRKIKLPAHRGARIVPRIVPGNADSKEQGMATDLDKLLPAAKDFMQKLALSEAEEASKEMRRLAETEAEKQALLDHFQKQSGLSDEEGIRRAMTIIERAVGNRKTEVGLEAIRGLHATRWAESGTGSGLRRRQ